MIVESVRGGFAAGFCGRSSKQFADGSFEITLAHERFAHSARLSVEKRKKGKIVTVVRGLPVEGNDLPELLTRLKNTCGAGGALKDDVLEIQGNQIDRVRDALQSIGYRVNG